MRADQEQIQQKFLVGPGGQTLKMTFMPHRIRLYCMPCTSILLYIPNLTKERHAIHSRFCSFLSPAFIPRFYFYILSRTHY